MRLIDADALATKIYEWMPKDEETWMQSGIPPIENLVVSIMMTIEEQPTIDAISVAWIEERISNAKEAGQTLIAQMWQELIDGYNRESK